MPISEQPPPTMALGMNGSTLVERLYYTKDILSDSNLAGSLTKFVNLGFGAQFTSAFAMTIWEMSSGRFKNNTEILDMLGPEGVFVVFYDGETPIACAGAVPWKVGSQEFAQPGETGYELKAVTVHPEWVKKGLATRVAGVVQNFLIAKERTERKESGVVGDGTLRLWIQCTAHVNDDYWRGRGYKDHKAIIMPAGFWSSKIDFTMAVLVKEVDVSE